MTTAAAKGSDAAETHQSPEACKRRLAHMHLLQYLPLLPGLRFRMRLTVRAEQERRRLRLRTTKYTKAV